MDRETGRRRPAWVAVVRTPAGAAAGALMALLVVLAVLAPVLWSDNAEAVNSTAISQSASAGHPLGTDALGRDILYRVLVATRLSLGLALSATVIGVVLGTLLGAAPSVLPRRIGRLLTGAVNIAVAVPGLLLALFVAVVVGVGTMGAVLAIGFAIAPAFARLVHTMSASVTGRDFVAAARVAGVGRVRLLVRHVLPNIAEPLVVNATVAAGTALLSFAGLSFLGIGVQAPSYDWGRLLGEGLDRIYLNPAAALAPGVAVVIAGLAFNLFGEVAAAQLGMRATSHRVPRRGRVTAGKSIGEAAPAAAAGPEQPVLLVRNLRVAFPAESGWNTPVRGVSFTVGAGEAVGVVGESGSGKSLTALAVSRLIEAPGEVTADRLEFTGVPLLERPERALRELLGTSLAMVFQDPATSFNPTRRIGRQLAEVSEQHQGLSRRQAHQRAVDRLRAVRVPAPGRRARQYPHEFSGGMRQRAMIATGMMGDPRLIVADEPTTALDVTVQRQVLKQLQRVRTETGAAILLISHDIAVVAQTCDRVLVMYAGRVVEDLPAFELLNSARHPYTRALLAATPDLDADRDQPLAVIPGRPPQPDDVPAGCAFAARCAFADDRCRAEEPALADTGEAGHVACWHPVAVSTNVQAPGERTPAHTGPEEV
ncbi:MULTISPECIES: dipeptide/oligopeptide/nickel ABC transporter permease/ATP-binding protein [unclassified Streptomyces]|uniref:dipeptide/oligopeptide/nickel ABC transporter permease/ATP-binding protein n=1 Tax=unclassified Streptomyces TaxID=2593676 RepID=UPI0035D93D5E